MTPSDVLGKAAAAVTVRLMAQGETGIRLQEVTPFSYEPFLGTIAQSAFTPRVILAGVKPPEARHLAKQAGIASGWLTGDLDVGTTWRNDLKIKDPLVLVAFDEEEKLGTFHRFTPVRDQDLYADLCSRARAELSPNQVLSEWWKVLNRKDIMRQVSVRRLAEYFLYLEQNSARLPDAAREGLYILGMLPSRTFFDHISAGQLQKKFHANRALLARIETLSNADRARLSRSLANLSGADRDKHQATIGRVLRYNASGSDADRKELWAEDVLRMLEANRSSTKKSKSKTTTTERAVTDAILADDTQEIVRLGQRLREELAKPQDEDKTVKLAVDLLNSDTQAVVTVSCPLLGLLRRAITADCLGGIFSSASVDSLDQVLDELDRAEFQPFAVKGEKTADTRIRAVVDAGYVEVDLLTSWEEFLQHRRVLANDIAAIAVSPLVALASEPTLLSSAREYLDAYEHLLAILKDRYEALSQRSPKGVRTLGAQILTMDVILLQTRSGLKAVLSPLHPMHLWKFVKLAEEIQRDKGTLNDDYKEVLSEHAENLPHFLTAVFVPEGLISEHALVLPESGHIQTLPIYQQDDLHFSGPDGQDRVVRILEKFLVLYRHAKARLRISLVDPPEVSSLLEQIAGKILNRDLDVQSLHLSVYRTLERPLLLTGNDQQLEAIAEVFSDDSDRAFILEVHPERTTYGDIIAALTDNPVHVLVVFDPSTAQVGQFISSARGLVHPLVLPKEFRYDAMEDELFITPATTGGMFDLYQNLQSRLNNSLTGSHFGISSLLGGQFPGTAEILKRCTWLVLVDRLLDAHPLKGGHMISYEQGPRRDLVVLTQSLTKFEREFDYQLRQTNFDPSPDAVRELIESSSELIGEGLLGLIRSTERDEDVL